MNEWSNPKSFTTQCRRGDEVLVVDRDNIQRRGGNRVTHRTIRCRKTDSDGNRFQLTEHQQWMCDDCNLVR
jgi:hypothetical protein